MEASAVHPMLELVEYHPVECVCFSSFLLWTERLREILGDRLWDDREAHCVFSASIMAASAIGSRAPDTHFDH